MALFEFKLPDIGEGVAEGEVVAWLVATGDQVVEDQELVEVMTDKATVTIGAPRAGSIAELRAAVGTRRMLNAEFRVQAPEGGWRWTNARAAPLSCWRVGRLARIHWGAGSRP